MNTPEEHKESGDASLLNHGPSPKTKSGGLRVAGAVLVVVAAVFVASGPLVRWIGTTAGIDALPYRETAWFANPAAASAGVKGGSSLGIAVTASRRSVVRWSEVVDGIMVSSGAVNVSPGATSDVRVHLPFVISVTWVKISIDRLPAPLRVEVNP